MRQIRCVFIFLFLFLEHNSTYALEVDASKFGFVFQLPKGWKVLRNSNPYSRPLLIVEKDRKAGMTVRVVNNYVLPKGDLHYTAIGWALARGAKFKTNET